MTNRSSQWAGARLQRFARSSDMRTMPQPRDAADLGPALQEAGQSSSSPTQAAMRPLASCQGGVDYEDRPLVSSGTINDQVRAMVILAGRPVLLVRWQQELVNLGLQPHQAVL